MTNQFLTITEWPEHKMVYTITVDPAVRYIGGGTLYEKEISEAASLIANSTELALRTLIETLLSHFPNSSSVIEVSVNYVVPRLQLNKHQ